jgi:hypothetical protein
MRIYRTPVRKITHVDILFHEMKLDKFKLSTE